MSRFFAVPGFLSIFLVSSVFAAQAPPDISNDAGIRKLEDDFLQAATTAQTLRDERRAKAKQTYDSSVASADAPYKTAIEGARSRWETARKKAIGATIEGMDKKIAELNKKGEVEAAKEVGRQKEEFTQKVIQDNARIAALAEEYLAAPEQTVKKKTHPADAVAFGNHWYKFYPDITTWHVAKRKCEEMGGNLVCLESAEEDQFHHQIRASVKR